MNVKNFLIAGIVGGLVDFLLGFLFYGIIFKDSYPETPDMKLEFIFLGCITFGLLMSYIFIKWAGIKNPITGLTAGASIGFLYGLSTNFFMYSNRPLDTQNFIIDVVISIIIGAGVGAAVALVNGKIK